MKNPDPSYGHDLSWLPPGPYTLDVLDILPEGRQYELVDGMLTINCWPTLRHQQLLGHVLLALGALLPEAGWTPLPSPGFSRNEHNYRAPDVAVCRPEAAARTAKHAFLQAEECLLLCEVVSEETALTDRITKPAEYASTGVPYYLRVEFNDPGRVENIENPHKEVESDPDRVFRQIGQTMTGAGPLPLPAPFTGPLDSNSL